MVRPDDFIWIGPSYVVANGFHFTWVLTDSEIRVINATKGSAQLLSKPIKILIVYEP